jgi:ectoine hydroxylase-related dioxygenase (phytanoyl-CoA dioxygenase family)
MRSVFALSVDVDDFNFVLVMNAMAGSKNGWKNTISKEFQTQGFVGPIDVLTPSEANKALEEVQCELASHRATADGGASSSSARFKLHLVLPTLDSIAHHPVIVEAVQRALQTDDILLWSSDVNTKPARSQGFFAPHQDSTYAGLVPASKCLTVWVALSDPVGEQEGCLFFYPMSHRCGQIPHNVKRPAGTTDGPVDHHEPSECTAAATEQVPTSTPSYQNNHDNNMLSLGQYISEDVIRQLRTTTTRTTGIGPPQSVPLRAGQMTFHSFLCIHYSGPNQSRTQDRVGFALRYVDGRNVLQRKPVKEMVTWISGTMDDEVCGRFDLEPRLPSQPRDSDIQRGRATRLEAIRREEANYFDGEQTW